MLCKENDDLQNYFQEAAQRYTDTSWHIFNQSRKKSPTPSLSKTLENGSGDKLDKVAEQNGKTNSMPLSNGTIPNSNETVPNSNGAIEISDGTETPPSNNDYERIDGPNSLQVVQIETVEVTYEPAKSQVEVVLVRHPCVKLTPQCIVYLTNSHIFRNSILTNTIHFFNIEVERTNNYSACV